MPPARLTSPAAQSAFTLPGLRWWIVGLVFFATLINYVDRLTLSVLAPVITKDLGLSNTEFGGIVTWFLLAYTISQGLSGKLYDRIGTKLGFTVSITVWSLAAMAHAFARGVGSLSAARFVLGLGEAGNWPGAAKAISEWFPVRQRALGMGLFNSGAAIGSIVAPPLIVFLQMKYGWQATFIATGSLGFIWLAAWWAFYRSPVDHPWLRAEELKLIRGELGTRPFRLKGRVPNYSWRELLRHRQVWAIVVARFFTDPVWWLYLTWLPLYLSQVHGFSLKEIGLFAWVPFVAADAGSLLGGWLSGHLIARGWSVDRARKGVIIVAAMLMPAGVLAAFAKEPMVALALIGVVLFGFQAWINNVQTLPSDFFPSTAVASVAGLGGTAAGIGSMIFVFTTGWVVDHFSYTPILIAAGVLAPIGTVALLLLSGPIRPLENS
ncbi:MAG TPA: MFS transporter [Verrucomicrobiae bacterium]|nr:MFS transporter [Verrucomicrobiae bacterium]